MRTEDDLRDALRLFADRATEVTIEPEVRRTPRRRVLIAAAVVAAIVAAIIVVPQVLRKDPPPAAPPPYGWHPFSVDLPTGWRRVTTELGRTASMTSIAGPDDQSCSIFVYKVGAFDPATIGGPKEPITVNGQAGWAGVAAPDKTTWARESAGVAIWEYASNGWARVSCGGKTLVLGSAEDQLNRRIAATVAPGAQPELHFPVSFGYLPDGFAVTRAVFVQKVDQPGDIVQLTLTKPGSKTREIVLWMEWPAGGVTDNGEHLVVDGRPARLEGPAYLRVWYPGFQLQLSAEGAGLAGARTELIRMVDEMRLANPEKPADWLPVRVGL